MIYDKFRSAIVYEILNNEHFYQDKKYIDAIKTMNEREKRNVIELVTGLVLTELKDNPRSGLVNNTAKFKMQGQVFFVGEKRYVGSEDDVKYILNNLEEFTRFVEINRVAFSEGFVTKIKVMTDERLFRNKVKEKVEILLRDLETELKEFWRCKELIKDKILMFLYKYGEEVMKEFGGIRSTLDLVDEDTLNRIRVNYFEGMYEEMLEQLLTVKIKMQMINRLFWLVIYRGILDKFKDIEFKKFPIGTEFFSVDTKTKSLEFGFLGEKIPFRYDPEVIEKKSIKYMLYFIEHKEEFERFINLNMGRFDKVDFGSWEKERLIWL